MVLKHFSYGAALLSFLCAVPAGTATASGGRLYAELTGADFTGGAKAKFGSTFYGRDRVNGTKGYAWKPEQYLEEIPVLAKYKMNFLINCYLSMFDDAGVGAMITRRAAESFKKVLKHRVILGDNYPVNDAGPTIHLGPLIGREPGLAEVLDGYMGNPLCPQNQINHVPLLTCADYAYNPQCYDPQRSIGQAIVHLAQTA